MKKNIIFQVFVISIILILWNSVYFGYKHQESSLFNELDEVPIIVFYANIDSLRNFRTSLESLSFIKRIFIESHEEITEKLMGEYSLESMKSVLTAHSLPNVMRIFLDHRLLIAGEKEELIEEISKSADNYIYSENMDKMIYEKSALLKKIFFLINILFSLFILFSSVLMRVHFEIGSDRFWEVFRTTGGKLNLRKTKFYLNSLVILFSPFFILIAVYFGIKYFTDYEFINTEIPYRLLLVEFGSLFLAIIVSRIFLSKRL